MSRARIAGIALLAHPAATRDPRGKEMAATLLDVSAGSRRRFVCEIADLISAGLRTRAPPPRVRAPGG